MKQDAEDAEGDPEKEVLVVEGECEGKADERACLAQSNGDDEAGLDELRILLLDGSFEKSFFKGKGKKKASNRSQSKADYHSRTLSGERLCEIECKKLTPREENQKNKHELRHQQRRPDDDERLVSCSDSWFLIH